MVPCDECTFGEVGGDPPLLPTQRRHDPALPYGPPSILSSSPCERDEYSQLQVSKESTGAAIHTTTRHTRPFPPQQPWLSLNQDEWGIRVETAPGPSFLSLPDVLHYNIASFQSDGSKGNESHLRVSRGVGCAAWNVWGQLDRDEPSLYRGQQRSSTSQLAKKKA